MTKSKNILGTVSAVVVGLLMCICSFVMFACGPKDYGENAIVISNYEELKTFLTDFSTHSYKDDEVYQLFTKEKYVVISNNIDCKGEVLTPLLTQDSGGLNFKFDGDGHYISNFKIDKTAIRYVASATGSTDGAYTTLALFPKSEGGELTNIEFKDFTYELQDYDMTNVVGGALKVGIVGYSKSSGTLADNPDNVTSTYKNVKITNMNINISSTSYTEGSYPFAIGALIGLDADTVEAGPANPSEITAMRENIIVKNFNVNIDIQGGPVMLGGISGHCNWENVTYKNSSVSGTFKVVNHGTEVGEYTRGKLKSVILAGGITGGVIKVNSWNIVNIDNVNTSIKYELTAASGNEHAHASKFIGIVCEQGAVDTRINISENCTSTSTVKVGEAEAVDVENNYLAK